MVRPLILLLAAASLSACTAERPEAPGNAGTDTPAADPAPAAVPAVVETLDRAGVLALVADAATRFTLGEAPGRDGDGKPFELRIRIGCDGPSATGSGWMLNTAGDAISVRIVPDALLSELPAGLLGPSVEGVQGHWLDRPWQRRAGCPVRRVAPPPAMEKQPLADPRPPAAPAAPAPAAGGRVAIARLVTADDVRPSQHRGRPYAITLPHTAGSPLPDSGFDFVVAGRLRAAGGRVVHCWGATTARPDCLVSADIDRAWLERPGDPTHLADWQD